MLTMNILGDGKDVWPYTDHNERYLFDCSKLNQWEIVFDHAQKLGVMLHFVLQETENETLLDNGFTDVQRMVYLPLNSDECKLKLDSDKTFSIKWFNPREGGELKEGSISTVKGPGISTIGNPPEEKGKDWVVWIEIVK